jgi:hypothetical protein
LDHYFVLVVVEVVMNFVDIGFGIVPWLFVLFWYWEEIGG